MVHIKISQGLDIPLAEIPQSHLEPFEKAKHIALNVRDFDQRFALLEKIGSVVKIGQPILEDKEEPGLYFVSPAAGKIVQIRRGEKRKLLDIVIEVDPQEETYLEHETTPSLLLSPTQIIEKMKKTGLFPHVRMRPFNLPAMPQRPPNAIFIKGLESAPFEPKLEISVNQYPIWFQAGIDILHQLCPDQVHLVYHHQSTCLAFKEAKNCHRHTAEGPHPIGNSSVHIYWIRPIRTIEDCVWTLNTNDVITIGKMFKEGKYHIQRVLSIAGSGIIPEKRTYLQGRIGMSIQELCHNRIEQQEPIRFISGNPLTGTGVETEDFMGFYDQTISVIKENKKREFLHFFRLGLGKFSATKTYISGLYPSTKNTYESNTNQHGEERAFIDGSIYDKVMPMKIPTMHLIKSVITEDFETAQQLGLLEVDSEDFALPTFICPSKIEMVQIIKKALKKYSKDLLGN